MGWSFLAIPALLDTCVSAVGGYFGAKCVVDYSISVRYTRLRPGITGGIRLISPTLMNPGMVCAIAR